MSGGCKQMVYVYFDRNKQDTKGDGRVFVKCGSRHQGMLALCAVHKPMVFFKRKKQHG